MKKCMEFRVEVRRPRGTCLENVEVNMTELEIDMSERNGEGML